MTDNATTAPWYRQPWFWFLTIFPLASIMWGITALTVSSSMDNSLVTDDYSKQGRGINMSIARDEKAADLQMKGSLSLNGRSATLDLSTVNGAAEAWNKPPAQGKDNPLGLGRCNGRCRRR